MNTPHDGEYRAQCSTERRCPQTVGVVEHVLCGLAGVLLTGALLLLFYPSLVALTQPLYVLSSTALVGAIAVLWLLLSFGAELAWEWRAGRLTGDR